MAVLDMANNCVLLVASITSFDVGSPVLDMAVQSIRSKLLLSVPFPRSTRVLAPLGPLQAIF